MAWLDRAKRRAVWQCQECCRWKLGGGLVVDVGTSGSEGGS
jgi:hypothetical protein